MDGVTFEFQASLHGLSLERGCYVMLEGDDGARLGQVTDIFTDTARVEVDGEVAGASSIVLRVARGSGLVLDQVGTSFHDAMVRLAEPQEVAAVLARANPDRAGLTIGELFHAPGVPAVLDSGGFNRHTFMCGQSGSGKTYSLGLLLEQVLAETELRVIILDPNSDYVGLGRVRADADPQVADRYRQVPDQVVVWGNDERADHPLRLRFAELDTEAQAAILGLDPVRDRDEYAVLADLLRQTQAGKQLVGLDQLDDSDTPGARDLGLRAANLGVLGWDIWAGDQPSVLQELREPERPLHRRRPGLARPDRGTAAGRAGRSSRGCGRCGRPGNPAWSCSTRRTTSAPPIPLTRWACSRLIGPSRSLRRAASSGSTCSSRPSGRTRCTRAWSRSATTP